jgi:hypothetical protein
MARRKTPKPRNAPRSKQERPPISFRIHRQILARLDALADRFNITRNELLERLIHMWLAERGDDVAALLEASLEEEKNQIDLFA